MSVSSITSGYSYYQPTTSQTSRKQELDALQQALQSGDLSGAQQAFGQLQQNAPNGAQSSNNSGGNAVITDISALGKALSANDLSGAQSAFSSLQTDFKNGPPPSSQDNSTSDTNNPQSLFEQLAQALQAGDLTDAQGAFSALQSLSPDSQNPTSIDGTGASENSTSSNSPGSNSTANPLDTDLSSLSAALQKGDVSSAQSAFQSVLEDLKSNASQHHHHHGAHVYAQNNTATNPSTDDTNTTDSTNSTNSTNSNVSITV